MNASRKLCKILLLRQGNIFTGVCQSFCSRGVYPSMHAAGGCIPACTRQGVCITAYTGQGVYLCMHWQGVCIPACTGQTGVYPSMHWGRHPPGRPPWADITRLGRHPPGQTPPQADTPPPRADDLPRRPLQRTVRIILECILVIFYTGRHSRVANGQITFSV